MVRFRHRLAACVVSLAAIPAAFAGTPHFKGPVAGSKPGVSVPHYNGYVHNGHHGTVTHSAPYAHKPTVFPQVSAFGGFQNYHLTHGVKFGHGFYYQGFQHAHWSKVYFSPVHGCQLYLCPFTLAEYYWCVPDGRYYPITYRPYGKVIF